MTNTINEALIPFAKDILPYVRSTIVNITRLNSFIMKAYADLLEQEHSEQEDRDLLADMRHHHDLIMHSLTHEVDILSRVGTQRKVEKYYNVENGELVEVDKEHFAGLPDEAEEV